MKHETEIKQKLSAYKENEVNITEKNGDVKTYKVIRGLNHDA